MTADKSIAVFQGKKIRRVWHDDEGYFSVIDIVEVLTDSSIPKRYWSDLKRKLSKEAFEMYDKIVQLKVLFSNGKIKKLENNLKNGRKKLKN